MKRIFVKIGEMKYGETPDILITMGLGSCVGVAIYDARKKRGALLHFLLPEKNRDDDNPFKYGNTGIRETLKFLVNRGSIKSDLEAKIVGGSVMFAQLLKNSDSAIGKRNIEIARQTLEQEGVSITGEDVGGDYGRSMEFNLESGEVRVTSYKAGEKVI